MEFFVSPAFWSVVLIWIGAVILPGADMFLIIRSACEGKRSAYFACLGILVGTIIWLIIGLFFIRILSKSAFFEIVQVLGGCYLLFMAWKIFFSKREDQTPQAVTKRSFFYGLLTNLSNPKPPIFVGILLSKIPYELSLESSLLLLCVMTLIPSIWFMFVIEVFSIKRFFGIFMRYARGIDYAVVVIFALFGLSLIFDGVRKLGSLFDVIS